MIKVTWIHSCKKNSRYVFSQDGISSPVMPCEKCNKAGEWKKKVIASNKK